MMERYNGNVALSRGFCNDYPSACDDLQRATINEVDSSGAHPRKIGMVNQQLFLENFFQVRNSLTSFSSTAAVAGAVAPYVEPRSQPARLAFRTFSSEATATVTSRSPRGAGVFWFSLKWKEGALR